MSSVPKRHDPALQDVVASHIVIPGNLCHLIKLSSLQGKDLDAVLRASLVGRGGEWPVKFAAVPLRCVLNNRPTFMEAFQMDELIRVQEAAWKTFLDYDTFVAGATMSNCRADFAAFPGRRKGSHARRLYQIASSAGTSFCLCQQAGTQRHLHRLSDDAINAIFSSQA